MSLFCFPLFFFTLFALQVTYNTLMTAYTKGGHYDKAVQVLQMMRNSGVAPDLYSYSILLDACAKTCSLQHAIKIFDVSPRHCTRYGTVQCNAEQKSSVRKVL